jgi:hypothetical protein
VLSSQLDMHWPPAIPPLMHCALLPQSSSNKHEPLQYPPGVGTICFGGSVDSGKPVMHRAGPVPQSPSAWQARPATPSGKSSSRG